MPDSAPPDFHTRCLQPPGRVYDAVRTFGRFAFTFCMKVKASGLEHAGQPGGVLLAVNHASHLDPACVSILLQRRVSWMSRAEFYDQRLSATFLDKMGAFPVNRQGHALPGIRYSLARLKRGEMVGIFPEGGITRGPEAAVHGGRIRHGVALLAARSGCPVIPLVVSGTHRLNRVGPWLPLKMGKLWLMAGPPLAAPPEAATRRGRGEFAARLEQEFVSLYDSLRRQYPHPETIIP